MSDEDRVGAAHRGGRMDYTNGIQALHFQNPLEALIAAEEMGFSEDEMRLEGMRRFINYLFGDRHPESVCYATRRLYSVAREFYPQLLDGVDHQCMISIFEESFTDPSISQRRCDSIAALLAESGDNDRGFKVRDETVSRLMCFIFCDDNPSQPILPMRRVYALAKSFNPEVLNGMSLHSMGEAFGEGDRKSNRARWSARIKVLIVETIEESGAVAHFKYQKTATTCRKYAEAQKGNQNRKKKP